MSSVKVIAGKITIDQFKRIEALYNKFEAATRNNPALAAQQAQQALAAARQVVAVERKQKLLQTAVQSRIQAELQTASDPLARAMAEFEYDPTGRHNVSNVEDAKRSMSQWTLAKLGRNQAEIAEALRTGRITDRDIIMELQNPNGSGKPLAADLANGWRSAVDFIVKQYEAAGGAIKLRKDWMMPQSHDADLLFEAGKGKWVSDIMPMLDRTRMVDRDTNLPLTDAELTSILQTVWDTLTSGGVTNRTPGKQGTAKKLANQLDNERVLLFRDGEWEKYNEHYGVGNVYDSMTGYLRKMSETTAIMQHLGPNPQATLTLMEDLVYQAAAQSNRKGLIRDQTAISTKIRSAYLVATNRVPYLRNNTSRIATGLRNLTSSSKLGSAIIANLFGDTSMNMMMSLMTKSSYLDYLRFATSRMMGSEDGRLMAADLGLVAENFMNSLRQGIRDGQLGVVAGNRPVQWSKALSDAQQFKNATGRLSDLTYKYGLVARHSNASLEASRLTIAATLGRNTAKSWTSLDPQVRRILQQTGVTEAEWNLARMAPTLNRGGSKLMNPFEIENHLVTVAGIPADEALDIAQRVHQAIMRSANLGTMEKSALTTRLTLREGGTLRGEMWGNTLQFTAFPIELFNNMFRRLAGGYVSNGAERAKLIGSFLILATLAGTAIQASRQIVRGENPVLPNGDPAHDLKWFVGAFTAGGGLPFIADLLTQVALDERSAGERIGGTVLGATGSTMVQGFAIGQDALQSLMNPGRDFNESKIIDFLSTNTPVVGSLFYTRLALNRLVHDNLKILIDPDAETRMRKRLRTAKQDGRSFW